jgi:hypothetical protein
MQCMQVARQVDVLDMRLKEEQESSLKALEAILANSGSPTKSTLSGTLTTASTITS